MSQKFLSDVVLSTLTTGSMLKLDSNGKIVEAVDGTDYISTSATGYFTASSGSGIYYSGDVRIGTYQTTVAPDAKLHIFDYQTTEPKLLIEDGNTGDASMQFKISSQSYTLGIDNSDSDKFVLSAGSVLGTGNLLEITSGGLAAFQNSVLVKGTLYINNQEQIQQGETEKIATFQNLGTERGYFEVTDTGKGYFYADGFKTGASTVGFLKSDGTVESGSFSDFAAANHTHSSLSGTSNDLITITSTYQADQGEAIIQFKSGSTEIGRFDTGGYFQATGFKTSTAATGFLKADGSVDTSTYASSTHDHNSDYVSINGGYVDSDFSWDGTHDFMSEIKVSGASATTTNTTALFYGTGGIVEKRDLGTAAFSATGDFDAAGTAASEAGDVQDNLDSLAGSLGTLAYSSATIPTNNNQLTNGAGYITSVPSEYLTQTEGDARYPRGKTVNYNSVDIESSNDEWYKIFQTTDSGSTPVECHVRGYAHSSISFIVSEGYLGSGGHVQVLDYCLSTNSNYKWIKGVRIISNGDVELLLQGGSIVSLEVTVIGDANVVGQPELSRAEVSAVKDTVVNLTTGMLRAKGVISGSNTSNWDTAYGWGDHDAVGYLTSVPSTFSATAITLSGIKLEESSDRAGILEINRDGSSAYAGIMTKFSGTAEWALMGDEGAFGLYDDQNNDWAWRYIENSELSLFHNGSAKIVTKSDGANVVGRLYATGGIEVPYGAGEHRPMIVLNNAATYGLFHTEAASDEFTFDFNGTQMFKFRQDGVFTINGNTITTGKVTNWDTAYGWGNHAGLYDAAGSADAVSTALSEEIGNLSTAVTDNTTQIASNRTAILDKLSLAEGDGRYGGAGKGNAHTSFSDLNSNPTLLGWTYYTGTTNSPHNGSQGGYKLRVGLGSDYGTNTGSSGHYAMEMLMPRTTQATSGVGYLYMRQMESGTWDSWSKVKAGYADSTPWSGITGKPTLATESYVTTAISNLVDSAPAALDTLNELAAALGDDVNFSTTVANNIGAVNTRIEEEVFPAIDTVASSIPTNNNQLTNGAGYITGYTETDTLNTVTGRGATTTNGIQVGSVFAAGTITDNATSKGQMLNYAVASFKPSSQNSGTLAIAQVDNGNSVGMQFTNGAGTADWDIALQPFGGKVGVGKVAPVQTLDVAGSLGINGSTFVDSSRGSIRLNSSNVGAGNGIFFRDGFNYNASITVEDHNGSYPDGICISGYDGVSFSTGSNDKNERMRITTAGRVGIGTTNPTTIFHAVGALNDGWAIFQRGTKQLYVNPNYSGTNVFAQLAPKNGDSMDLSLAGNDSRTNDIYIKHDTGNVGIGTTDPSEKLSVVGNATIHSGSNLGTLSVGRSSSQNIKIYVDDTNNTITAYQDSDGNSEHIFALDRQFDGTGANNFFIRKGGSNQLKLDTSGNLRLYSYGAGILKTDANGNVSLDTSAYALQEELNNLTSTVSTIATDVSNNRTEITTLGTNKLDKSGGTMTGALVGINATFNSGAAYPLRTSSGQRYGIQVRNTANTVNANYGWWWFMDTNFNMGFHADGAADRFTLTRNGDLSVSGKLSAGNGMWVNGNNATVYNNYNENLRLPPAGNNVSVIAFRATGEGGEPSSSILGYSDRHEVRIGGTWRERIYAGTTSINNTLVVFGDALPDVDRTRDLGRADNRWRIVFCEILDSAGQHEKNLQNPEGEKSVGEYETGTVLVWKGGKNVPCTEAADHMRMGIAVKGIDSPLIQGAEPVLVTGSVNEGDYLVTSRKEGHAEAISPEFMRQHGLYDCVLGKALESAEGESHLVKTWINI